MSKIRWLFAAAVVIGTMAPQTSRAVPAFARQTGMECAACHVGSFGPQLTQFGRMFKLGGFTMGDNITNPLEHFSAMVYAGYTDVADKLAPGTMSPPNDRFGRDNTWTIDQASLFYGGKIYGGVGAMLQATYKDPNRSFAWDNSDIRYADTVDVGGTSLLLGVTLNNNPGVQDAWQGTPAWKFPYLSPTITSTPSYNPLILGAQAQKVIGGGVYGLWNDWVYGELSTYSGFGAGDGRLLGMMGGDTAARLNNFNPYGRLALQHEFGEHYLELGAYGMIGHQSPSAATANGTDTITDKAFDATWQWSMDGGKHIISAYGTAIREKAVMNSSLNAGSAANSTNDMQTYTGNVSYYYNNTYGATVGRTATMGNADTALYTSSNNNNRPGSRYWTFQVDYTPFGTADSPLYPYINPRFFLQYTAYDQFNGVAKNYDGNGRNAFDNNTLYGGVWMAF